MHILQTTRSWCYYTPILNANTNKLNQCELVCLMNTGWACLCLWSTDMPPYEQGKNTLKAALKCCSFQIKILIHKLCRYSRVLQFFSIGCLKACPANILFNLYVVIHYILECPSMTLWETWPVLSNSNQLFSTNCIQFHISSQPTKPLKITMIVFLWSFWWAKSDCIWSCGQYYN